VTSLPPGIGASLPSSSIFAAPGPPSRGLWRASFQLGAAQSKSAVKSGFSEVREAFNQGLGVGENYPYEEGVVVMATIEMWTFTIATPPNVDLSGFKVEARDGSVGKVDEATHEAGGSFVVVDTGPWIFGKKVMLPAGLIRDLDPDTETIFVDLTKDEIKNAPEFDESTYRNQTYRDELGRYYTGHRVGSPGTGT